MLKRNKEKTYDVYIECNNCKQLFVATFKYGTKAKGKVTCANCGVEVRI